MYKAKVQQADENKGAPAQDSGRNANSLEPILEAIMGDGNSAEWVLLQDLAWLDHKFISEDLLLARTGNNQAALRSTIENLETIELVKTISKAGVAGLSMTLETQDQIISYALHNPKACKRPDLQLESMLQWLGNLLPEVSDKQEWNLQEAGPYIPTIEILLDHTSRRKLRLPEDKNLALLYSKLGAFYCKVSIDAQKSLDYQARALEIYQATYQGNHPDIASSLNTLGSTYSALGQHSKALPYLENALTMKRSLYASPHHDVANSLSNLGSIYVTLGEGWKGIAHLLQALMMNQVLYHGAHTTIASSLTDLGNAYASVEANQALEYHKQALAMYESLYEAPQPDIAMALHNVGDAQEKLGYTEQGLSYKERALEMRQVLYGSIHPEVASSLYSAGIAYEKLGDVVKGLNYQERALEIRQTLYPGNHPDVATSLNAVSVAYYKLEDFNKCLDYCKLALAMKVALYPGNHPEVVIPLNNVGLAYKKLGDDSKARDYFSQAYGIRHPLEGNHPTVADKITSVGAEYEQLENSRKALHYYEQALAMGEALHPGNHFRLVASLNNVGRVYQDLGDVRKGLDYRARAIMMRHTLEGNEPYIARSLNSIGIEYEKLGDLKKGLGYKEQALKIREILYPGNHHEIVDSLKSVGSAYEGLGDINKANDYFGRADKMKRALNEKEEFKGQGTLSYGIDSRFEYYNSALDQILNLRLRGIGYDGKAVVLKSRYFGEGFTASRLANDVGVILASGDVKIVLAPVNLYNQHWLGLLFNGAGTRVEVTYMDSEQRSSVPQLNGIIESRLVINSYENNFKEVKLERQRYNNCGSEVIENFVYYLTGTRATQEAAVYVHSLLVENSLLDSEEYGLKLEENTRLIGFLSNAAPLPIRSIGVTFMPSSDSIREPLKAFGYPRVKQEYNNGALGADGQAALNLLLALEQFNRLAAKWVQDKLQQVNAGIYKTTLGFKGLDLAVDSARLVYDPEPDNAKKVALDAAQLYGMYSGVNGYSALVTGAEVVYQLHLGEYQKACDVAAGTVSSMALPVILAYANKPYLGFVYSLFVAASTVHNALENTYSFIKELAGEDRSEESRSESIPGQVLGSAPHDDMTSPIV